MLRLNQAILAAILASAPLPAMAELPAPSPAAAPRQAQAFLYTVGASDIFEATTGMMAVQRSQSADVREFGSMLIDHHTRMTSGALATARSAGVMPPPPELSPAQKAMIAQLSAAGPAQFDHVFLMQQVGAHQQALALLNGYSSGGDVPALRDMARGAIPTVQSHLARAQALMAAMHR